MINRLEQEYPYSIDQYMYEIYCAKLKKRSKRRCKRRKNSGKSKKPIDKKLLSKKKKIEFFSNYELKDTYLDKLKIHLHLNLDKRHITKEESELIIDLSSSTFQSDEIWTNEELDNTKDENFNISRLIIPQVE